MRHIYASRFFGSLLFLMFLTGLTLEVPAASQKRGYLASFWPSTAAERADILTTDGVGDALGAASEQTSNMIKNGKTMKDLVASKKITLRQQSGYKAELSNLTKNKMKYHADYKKNLYKEHKKFKGPDLKTTSGKAHKLAKTRMNDIASKTKTKIGTAQKGMNTAKTQGKNLNVKIHNQTVWGRNIKGMLQETGKYLAWMDIAGAAGRVAGETYHAAFEGGSFANAYDRVLEEYGRMKAGAYGAATVGTVGSMAGPGGTIAGAFIGGYGASKQYAMMTEKFFEDRRNQRVEAAAYERLGGFSKQELEKARLRAAEARALERERRRAEALAAPREAREAAIRANEELRAKVDQFNKEYDRQKEQERKRAEEWGKKQMKKEAAHPLSVKLTMSKNTAKPGEKLAVRISVSGGTTPYQLSGATSGNHYEPESIQFAAPREPGSYTIKISARGANGRVGSGQTSYQVVSNFTIQMILNKNSMTPGETFPVNVRITGGEPPYQISGVKSGKLDGPSGRFSFKAPKKPGNYYLDIVATDKNNITANHRVLFKVANTAIGADGTYTCNFGGDLGGSFPLKVRGRGVSGKYNIREKDGEAHGSWKGNFNPETGQVTGSISGRYRMIDFDGKPKSGSVSGSFSGRWTGSGFQGTWSGMGNKRFKGQWAAN